VWARKEALLKAYGLGLAVDPASVRLDPDGIAAWPSTHPRPGAVRWHDVDLPGYAAVVAVLPHHDRHMADLEVIVRGSED
jgi:phosphopantetheinyl transferase